MKILVGIFGAGGCGREILEYVAKQKPELESEYGSDVELYFVDDAKIGMNYGKVECVSEAQFFQKEAESKYFNIAINDSRVRESIFKRVTAFGAIPLNVVSDEAFISAEANIGPGLLISRLASINTNTNIGRSFHCNYYSYVSHDCVIGDFVTFAPGVMCNGNVVIENHAYIGAGAILRQGTSSNPLVVGEGAIVGMGAVVTKDVPPNSTVVGNPARILESRST